LAALPLKEGFKANFPSLSEDHDEIDWIAVVVGKARARGGRTRKNRSWLGPSTLRETTTPTTKATQHFLGNKKRSPTSSKLVTTIPTGKWVTVTISMI